jgi:hypothetical protein
MIISFWSVYVGEPKEHWRTTRKTWSGYLVLEKTLGMLTVSNCHQKGTNVCRESVSSTEKSISIGVLHRAPNVRIFAIYQPSRV